MKKKTSMIFKDPIISMMNKSLMNLPTPSSITYMWNMGFMLGMTLMLQIVTGLFLSMNFINHTSMAFDSVIHIMRDIDNGWLMRFIHSNGASLFFVCIYLHIFRGVYFNSPANNKTTWLSGIIILLLSMMTAFMGYVLPWGQMSFWGATVITSMVSAIPYLGKTSMYWMWGNFSISQPTLNRFLSLHFILPLVITMIVMIHLILLHEKGSSNPSGLQTNLDKSKFFPMFLIKDLTTMMMFMMLIMTMVSMSPNLLMDVENFIQASQVATPTHIQPEWYFLFAYTILRSVPSKLGGVMAMVASILILVLLAIKKPKTNKKFSPAEKTKFWSLISCLAILTWIGMNPAEYPFSMIGMMFSIAYFINISMMIL